MAARDPPTDCGHRLATVLGGRAYVDHQRLERPDPQIIGAPPPHPRRATRDRPPRGSSRPPATRTRPCGAGPSCEPNRPVGGVCGCGRARGACSRLAQISRWRRRPGPAGPHRGRCCSWAGAAQGAAISPSSTSRAIRDSATRIAVARCSAVGPCCSVSSCDRTLPRRRSKLDRAFASAARVWSGDGHAAVDGDDGAVEIAGVVGQEEGDELGDVVGLADAAERNPVDDPLVERGDRLVG
jgi:hypothetical protein